MADDMSEESQEDEDDENRPVRQKISTAQVREKLMRVAESNEVGQIRYTLLAHLPDVLFRSRKSSIRMTPIGWKRREIIQMRKVPLKKSSTI